MTHNKNIVNRVCATKIIRVLVFHHDRLIENSTGASELLLSLNEFNGVGGGAEGLKYPPPHEIFVKGYLPPRFLARLMAGFERVHEHDNLTPHQNGRDSDESTNDIVDCRQAFLQRYSTDVE